MKRIIGFPVAFGFVMGICVSASGQGVYEAWVARYNGTGDGDDFISALAVDDSGHVYVTGISPGSGSSNDYATIKYAPNGDTQWVRRYNGPLNSPDYAYALAIDNNSNVYVTGQSFGSGSNYDYATIKYLPNGDTAWVRTYNGPGNLDDGAYALAIDGSGNVYVTGASWNGSSYDFTTIKYAPNGDSIWERRYNDLFGRPSLAVDGSGNVYVTGPIWANETDYDYITIKYASNGDTLWTRRYNGPNSGSDWPVRMVLDDSGNVIVTGNSQRVSSSYGNRDFATI